MHFFEFKLDSNNRVASIVLYTTQYIMIPKKENSYLNLNFDQLAN